jgi:tetratricopeptide (TPR) repeat protein/DNA-binding XRE family transcriptional regulator
VNAVDEQDASFGRLLQQHRAAAGLTQEELAERAGLSVRALRDMERGRTQRPYRHSVLRVADALMLAGQARARLVRVARTGATGSAYPGRGANRGGASEGQASGGGASEGRASEGQASGGGASEGGASGGGASGGEADGLGQARESGQRPGARPVPLVPMQLPAMARHFAGRAEELQELDALLGLRAGQADRAMVIAVTGTAGVGKTTLAVHWAHEAADRFPDGQLFVNLRGFDLSSTPANPEEVIRGFLAGLQVPSAQVPSSPAAQAGLYRSLTAQRAMLVVLDNARDADQVRPLLPGGRSCLVVVTSRSELPGLAVAESAHPISLDVLSPADARELLADRMGAERLASQPQAADELVRLCARLPLALAIAASRAAARPQLSLAMLADQIRDAQARLDSLGTGDAATSLRAVFSWSYDLLRSPAARMFRLLGLHPGPDISVPAATSLAGLPMGDAAALLAELSGAHLIEERVPGRYAFHDLMRSYAAEQAMVADDAQRRQDAVERVLDHYLHTAHAAELLLYPARDPITVLPHRPSVRPEPLTDHAAALAWFTAEHQTLLAACAHAASQGLDRHAWQLPWTMVHFLDMTGRWNELATIQQRGITAAQRLADLEGQANAHCDLGRALVRLGRLDDADAQLRTALSLQEQAGCESARARLHLDLAQVAGRRGRHHEALAEDRLALDLYRAIGALPGQARALNNIGWTHAALDDFERAVKCCAEALELNRSLGHRLGEAANLDSLGYAYLGLGRYREAEVCCRSAEELFLALGDRYNRAVTLIHLGDAHRGNGHVADARAAWRQALAIMDDLRHPEAATVRARLRELVSPGRPQ